MERPRIYLDNAATSWPKPESVYQAVDVYLRNCGAAAGRGVYSHAVEADRLVTTARLRIAQLIGATKPEQIIFTLNCTDALNLALQGFLEPESVVLTSEIEHNSVLRPLRHLQETRRIRVAHIRCDDSGLLDLKDLELQLRESSSSKRTLICSHASNVTGVIQPLAEIMQLAERYEVPLIVDAAQSAGALPISVKNFPKLLLAASGHKGLLGTLGTGFLYVSPGMEGRLTPLRFGGTGTQSDEDRQPDAMPERYESGNANVPGLAGLAAGVDYVLKQGVAAIHAHEQSLINKLMAGLAELPGIRLFGPPVGSQRVGLVAFTVEGYDAREFASVLDANFGIQVRAGLHCAPLIHRRLACAAGGSVRMSVGPFTTNDEIEIALAAIRDVVAS